MGSTELGEALLALGSCEVLPGFGKPEAQAAAARLVPSNGSSNNRGLPLAQALEGALGAAGLPQGEALAVHLVATAVMLKIAAKQTSDGFDSDSDDEGDESSSEGGATPMQEDDAGTTPASDNLLAGMSADAIADRLVEKFNEPATMRSAFKRVVDKLGAEGVWQAVKDTAHEIATGGELTKVNSGETRQRTPGGIFLKLAKKREGQAQMAAAVAAAPVFQLRPYQLQAVEHIQGDPRGRAVNWVVAAPTNTGKTAIFIELSKRLLGQNPRAKVVVLVPTLALVRQQCAAYERAGFQPAGHTSTQAALAAASAAASAAAPSGRRGGASGGPPAPPTRHPGVDALPFTVDWFCGEKQLQPDAWARELGLLSVLVVEAQSFRRLVEARPGGRCPLQDVSLLVLDECHHAGQGDHPYAVVMDHWATLPPQGPRPQVLGFSASPVNGKSEAQVHEKLTKFLAKMGGAALYVVNEEDALVQQVAPAPSERQLILPPRAADGVVREWLHTQLYVLAVRVAHELTQLLSQPEAGPRESRLQASDLLEKAALPGPEAFAANHVQAFNELCRWMRAAHTIAKAWAMQHLGSAVALLEVLRRASALCDDVGYEAALLHMGQRTAALATHCSRLRAAGSASTEHKDKRVRRSTDLAGSSSSGTGAGTGPGAAAGSGAGAGTPGRAGAPAASGTSAAAAAGAAAVAEQDPMAVIQAYGAQAPLPQAVQQEMLRRACSLAALPPLTGDVPSDALALGKDLMVQLQARPPLVSRVPSFPQTSSGQASGGAGAGAGAGGDLVRAMAAPLQPGGVALGPGCFPKLQALIQYLREKFRGKSQFHGIIFCATRQGARYLTEVLRAVAAGKGQGSSLDLLQPGRVHLLVGHGASVNDKSRPISGSAAVAAAAAAARGLQGLGVADGAGTGMSVKQQQAVIEAFKAPGCALLVATNAAEEGLDVPSCEVVVRFSPPATGTQRLQGRGRARKADSEHVALLQSQPNGSRAHGGVDGALHNKSELEEAALRRVLADIAARGQLAYRGP